MLVRSVDVSEFRGVRRLAKPLELSELTVLVGRNNAGKTALLEAMYLLAAPYTAYTPPPYSEAPLNVLCRLHRCEESYRHLVYGYAGTATLTYRLAEAQAGGRGARVELEIGEGGLAEVRLNGNAVGPNDYEGFLKSVGCGLERGLAALYIPNHTGYYEKLEEFALREEVLRWAEKHGVHRRVAELVSGAVDDRFTEALVRRDRLSVRKEVEGGLGPLYVDVDSLGEGVRRFILAYLAVEYLNPRILLWDDLEVAMHPSLLEAALDWLVGGGRQVVIATHSIDVLYALTLRKPGDARVVVLGKRGDDTVEYRSLSLDEVEEMLDSGVDLRRVVGELRL